MPFFFFFFFFQVMVLVFGLGFWFRNLVGVWLRFGLRLTVGFGGDYYSCKQ